MIDVEQSKLEDATLHVRNSGLFELLSHLDRRLARAVAVSQQQYGPEATADPFRGMHVSQSEVERLLTRQGGLPLFGTEEDRAEEPLGGHVHNHAQLAWIERAFGLSPFDREVLLIALAPELDLRYERLYAFLQDDISRKRPSVDLILNLLCSSGEDKIRRRGHFSPEAPLIRHGVIHLVTDPAHVQPSFLAQVVKLDDHVCRLLLGEQGIDARLASFATFMQSSSVQPELPFATEMKQTLRACILHAQRTHRPVRFYFAGPGGSGKRQVAWALASEFGVPLLKVDGSRLLTARVDYDQTLKRLFREAWIQQAILYVEDFDAFRSEDREGIYHQFLEHVEEFAGICILAGTQGWVPYGQTSLGVFIIPFPSLDVSQSLTCWQNYLGRAGITLSQSELELLTSRFRLTPDQIVEAIGMACHHVSWRQSTISASGQDSRREDSPTLNELCVAASAQCGHQLAKLAKKIDAKYTWDDIALPADQLKQLKEICDQAYYRRIVFGEWGFDRRLSLGKGLNVLFSGPPGTGKTMAAEVIANELLLPLYKIDLSQVVSKYIGETEKNLDRIFVAAQSANAILFFDEADSLFGKRSEVRDAHDRYANIEVGYLLQKMEEYEGVAILATNLRQHMDDAFVRRMQVIIEFPFPDEASRMQIWRKLIPHEVPLSPDVDQRFLAQHFKLSGGHIRNVVLAAAFFAAADGEIITMEHVIRATKREYQKLGWVCRKDDFGPYYPLVKEPNG